MLEQPGKFVSSVHVSRSFALLLLIVIALGALGCPWREPGYFDPVPSKKPITMFNRYQLKLSGTVWRLMVFANIMYLTQPDTLRADTLPFFLIDSMCVTGACLEQQRCYATAFRAAPFALPPSGRSDDPLQVSLVQGLVYGQWVYPGEFRIESEQELPAACKGHDLAVAVHARLVDQHTKVTLARETKLVPFYIHTRWGLTQGI